MKRFTLTALAAILLGSAAAQAITITVVGDPIKGGQLAGTVFTEALPGELFGQNSTPGGGGERAPLSIDGDIGTKYLNFGQEFTGYIVLPAGGLSNVTGINFVTANDSPDRDPASYTVYGSNSVLSLASSTYDLITNGFTEISTGLLTLPNTGQNLTGNLSQTEGRGYAASVSFGNAAAYTSYLLVFPTIRNTNTANSMQIAEATLQGTFVPEPTSALLLSSGLVFLGTVRRRRA